MASEYTTASVLLWGRLVGAVSEHVDTGRVVFEYDPDFQRTGLEISPLELPLDIRGPQSFPELSRSPAFLGLPGVLADSLPDKFGNAIIRRYFERLGRPSDALSPVQKLLYIGSRGMGALEFSPAEDVPPSPRGDEALELQVLVEQSRRVIEGDVTVAIPEMMRLGGSAGGARPKALVQLNPDSGEIRSPFATSRPGDEPWLVKFDGVTRDSGGLGQHADFKPQPWGRVEFVFSLMAKAAGIDMCECRLIRHGEFAHFATRRFDVDDGQRLHMHTLGGLVHVDFNHQQVYSYEEYFDAIRALDMGQDSIDEAYRRLVFTLSTLNRDDHVKNFAFLMRRDGEWRLSPAYDVTYAAGSEWTQRHQMSVNGKFIDHTRVDVLAIGEKFDVPRDGATIIEEVSDALSLWPEEAAAVGLDTDVVGQIGGRIFRF